MDALPAATQAIFHKVRIDLAVTSVRAILRKIMANSAHWISDANQIRLDNIDAELTAFVDEHLQEFAEATNSRFPWRPWKSRTPKILSLQAQLVHHVNKTAKGVKTPRQAIDRMKILIACYATPERRR